MRYPFLCLAIALPWLPALPALAAPGPADPKSGESIRSRDHADELFDKGKEAFNLGKIEDAYALYQKAWALKQTHDIAGNMAQAELKLGRVRAAAEHISFAIAHFPPTSVSDPRPALEKVLVGLRQQLGVMHLKLNVPGAKIAIDGRALGESQSLDEVFVEPGAHTFVAELAGYANATATETATAGSRNEVTLTLVKEAPVERTELPKPPNPIVEPVPRSKLPGIVVGATGGVGLGVGLALLAIGGGKGTSADDLLSQVRTREGIDVVCPKAAECAEIKSLRSTRDNDVNAGRVLVGIGSAALVVGVAYLLWPQAKPESTGKVRVAPMASPTSGGVWLTGAF